MRTLTPEKIRFSFVGLLGDIALDGVAAALACLFVRSVDARQQELLRRLEAASATPVAPAA